MVIGWRFFKYVLCLTEDWLYVLEIWLAYNASPLQYDSDRLINYKDSRRGLTIVHLLTDTSDTGKVDLVANSWVVYIGEGLFIREGCYYTTGAAPDILSAAIQNTRGISLYLSREQYCTNH